MNIKKIIVGLVFFSVIILTADPCKVFAADAAAIFGSDSYENESGAEFPVGVYIQGDSEIGYYKVDIDYDPERLRYIEGATEGENGHIIVEGVGSGDVVSTMLRFQALSGGETNIKITDARVMMAGNEEEQFNITEMADVPVSLSGEDIVSARQSQTTEGTVSETVSESETVSSSETDKPSSERNESQDVVVTLPAVIAGILTGVLAVIISLLVIRRKKRAKIKRHKQIKSLNKPNTLQKDDRSQQVLKQPVVQTIIPVPDIDKIPAKLTNETEKKGEPVIDVRNVTMIFKGSGKSASGLKDYMIQKAQGKIKSKPFKALDNVSFTVYKGEVVGIIGTNGSGKSTLLKIVSGALRPTYGEVIADKSKIQLLTLGTGFDGELSARENVYLNGAIIGYSKEFIDEHYDEIVKFAELENFMGEKVKNFSSGMVSRLAFSIATVADAAEILILDEVLSVGDQFFRKKSMKRVKEMIHGGSTVLIVSHSLHTIKEHCTKAVWIEKGVLQKVGEPEEVCKAYAKQHEKKRKQNSE